MSVIKVVVHDNPANWRKKALHELKHRISPFVFIQESKRESANRHLVDLGTFVQDAILDKNEGLVIKYVRLENIASFNINLKDNRFLIEGPSKTQFLDMAQRRYSNIVDRAHQALLPSIYQEIVQIEEVTVYLRPLEKILDSIEQTGHVKPEDIKKPKRKTNQYFTLLASLKYIRPENGYFVAGKAMEDLRDIRLSSTSLYKRILANVIETRSKYIHDVMRLPLINVYLKWANAYYFPSYRIGQLIRINKSDYLDEYRRFYGTPREPAQINRLRDVSIIKERKNVGHIFYEGYQEKLDEFTERANELKIMEQPITR